MENETRVGVYARISDDRDGQQTATARQLEDCHSFAERRGWTVAEVFEDVDISAFDARARRPGFLRMLEALRHGEIDGVLVWKLDRLTRQQRDLVRVMEACEPHKAFIASVTEPINTADNMGQFVAELLVAQARMESANTSMRQRRKAREQRERGVPPSNGRRCFGYDARYATIIEAEAVLLREARDRVLAGESLRSICQDWEVRGVLTTGGKPWRTQFLRRILMTPTLAAYRELDGTLYPGLWQPIFTIEEHRRLKEFFGLRSGTKRPATVGLLTGYIRCSNCGGRMFSSRREDRARRYICRKTPGTGACGKMSILADPLEAVVAEMLVVAVDEASLRTRLTAKDERDDGLFAAIRTDEEALESLARDYYVERLLSRDEFLAARTALSARLETNRERLAKGTNGKLVGRFAGRPGLLRDAWDGATLEWRRSLLAALVEHFEIRPGKPGRLPFDAERVYPVWKY